MSARRHLREPAASRKPVPNHKNTVIQIITLYYPTYVNSKLAWLTSPWLMNRIKSHIQEQVTNTSYTVECQLRFCRSDSSQTVAVLSSLWSIGPVYDYWDWPIRENPSWPGRKQVKCRVHTVVNPGQKSLASTVCVQVAHESQTPCTKCVRVGKIRASTRTHTPPPHMYIMQIYRPWRSFLQM